MAKTAKFFSKSAKYIRKCQADENYCVIMLHCLLKLAEKIGSSDRLEAHYFLTSLQVFESELKNIADPSEYNRIFKEIHQILDRIIDPDNYPPQAERPDETESFLPIIMAKLK
ncbi:MAG: hypothetical protein WC441_01105 [Patescibacteria group bacterium]